MIKVEIETEWNLELLCKQEHKPREAVEIETEWNLESFEGWMLKEAAGRDRNRVEFRVIFCMMLEKHKDSRDRNRVEFRVETDCLLTIWGFS